MSDNRIRPFWGELLQRPDPLEVSYNTCTYGCTYCFASLNGRDVHGEKADGSVRFIAKAFSQNYEPANLGEYLLHNRHGVCLSNAVDPLAVTNLEATREILRMLQRYGVPVLLQTRGFPQPARFREILNLLPKGSAVYSSITSFREDVHREIEKRCPSNEARLEQLAMAAEAGFNTCAAFNPAVPDWMGDPYKYVERCAEIAGKDRIHGVWYEAMHLSKRQLTALKIRHKGEFPEIARQAYEDARGPEYDPEFFEALEDAIDEQGWGRFSHNVGDGTSTLFDRWTANPFITHHPAVAECQRLYREHQKPILVSYDAWASWVGLDDHEPVLFKAGEVWAFLNQKQNYGKENRAGLPELLDLREVIRLAWNRPDCSIQAVYSQAHFKALVSQEDPEDVKSTRYLTDEDEGGNILCAFAPDHGGEGSVNIVPDDEILKAGYVVLPIKGTGEATVEAGDPSIVIPDEE